MPNYFTLTLDTTGPSNPTISLEGGATYATQELVTATIGTSDGVTTNYQMKIWGDIDKSYDTGAQTQENSIVDPSTVPTLAAAAGTSGLSAGTYYIAYSWYDGYGETLVSTEASVTITAGQNINVTLPTFPVGNNISARIYIGTASGLYTLQGSTATTSYVQSSTLVAGAAKPSSNTLTGSTWITYATSKQIKLSAIDGAKTAYVKIRDDVNNESAQASDGISLDTTIPIVSITGPDVSKISKQTGKNTSSFSFSADDSFIEYKVMYVGASTAAHNAAGNVQIGTLTAIGTWTNASVINISITGTELETANVGDGAKLVKVFVKDSAGMWSV